MNKESLFRQTSRPYLVPVVQEQFKGVGRYRYIAETDYMYFFGKGVDFLLEGMVVDVVSDASTETILYADVPVKVQMKITYTEPGLKGDTATNTLKPATVESGAEVRVPLFINEGDMIEIDTRDGSYVSRVNTK